MAGPVLDAIFPQQHACRIGAGIVGAHYFNRTAIARALLLNHDYSVVRLLTRSEARQTNHQHRISVPFSKLLESSRDCPASGGRLHAGAARMGMASVLLPTHQVWRNQWLSASAETESTGPRPGEAP